MSSMRAFQVISVYEVGAIPIAKVGKTSRRRRVSPAILQKFAGSDFIERVTDVFLKDDRRGARAMASNPTPRSMHQNIGPPTRQGQLLSAQAVPDTIPVQGKGATEGNLAPSHTQTDRTSISIQNNMPTLTILLPNTDQAPTPKETSQERRRLRIN